MRRNSKTRAKERFVKNFYDLLRKSFSPERMSLRVILSGKSYDLFVRGIIEGAINFKIERGSLMVKKMLVILLTGGIVLCSLTGCKESAPTDELVKSGQASGVQEENRDEVFDIPAGSPYVENERAGAQTAAGEKIEEREQQRERTFPTLSKLHELVIEGMGDHYWPEIPLSAEDLAARTGITSDMYVEFLGEVQIMETNIDMMLVIRAKEDYVGAIEQALENYRNKVIEENLKYPQNLCKAKASRMETVENYICFVQLGADTSIVADKGEKEMISYCQEENERVIDILEKAILQS